MWINLQCCAKLFFRVSQLLVVFKYTSQSEMGAHGIRFLLNCGLQFAPGPRSISFSKKRKRQVVVSFPVLVFQLERGFKSSDAA